ncbi:MAG: 4-(cytidine 5'-diphospho)-2-C-methyl-D-erythritol kinase [Candidatus Synoicihabitans palmerolidicus]|nr:4-(cytidine 5'-diphospho)-2-C-methyl-D-erythritol kinase [Candidatus Synoicihabitans palmerolidicus]
MGGRRREKVRRSKRQKWVRFFEESAELRGVDVLTEFCLAKLNLFLAITGKRPDGFHDLVSVAAPLDFGDTLTVEPAHKGGFSLTCDDPAVPTDESNLVLRAARLWADAAGWTQGATFHLSKRVPMGAGLGGGSSDATGALRALNKLSGGILTEAELQVIAAEVGSDCPLFLRSGPVVMRGWGELLSELPENARRRLVGRRVLVFKPAFGISTVWAYRALTAAREGYLPTEQAEKRLSDWVDDEEAEAEKLGFNSMEREAFRKYGALPVMLKWLWEEHRLQARMSGSGSACYVWLRKDVDEAAVTTGIFDRWGKSTMVKQGCILDALTLNSMQ